MNLDIGLAFDNNYAQRLFPLIKSICVNNTEFTFRFHLIHENVNALVLEKIQSAFITHEFFLYSLEWHGIERLKIEKLWTASVYLKLFLPLRVVGNVQKLLYLDMDTLVIGPLNELFATELDNYPVACVYDNYVKMQPLIGIAEEGKYFNSGVMLINVPKWNELKVTERTMEYVESYPERIQYVDQCGLNAVLINLWKQLPFKFNVLYSYIPQGIGQKQFTLFMKDMVILHFTLQRPWNYLCENRARHLYFKYVLLSGQKIKFKDFSIWNIPAKVIIIVKELYQDYDFLQVVWRCIKNGKEMMFQTNKKNI